MSLGLSVDIAGLGDWLNLGLPPVVAWQVHAELTSTNTHAMQEWALATTPPLALPCVLALSQTAGRGRLGRTWQSANKTNDAKVAGDSSVCWSFVWPCSAVAWPLLPVAVGLGVVWGLNAWADAGALGVRALIKWPNDVYLQDCKVAGVLCEVVHGCTGPAVVVGVGINRTEQAWGVMPAGSVMPTALAQHWLGVQPLPASLALAKTLWPWVLRALRLLHCEGPAAVVLAFAEVDGLQGRALRVVDAMGGEAGMAGQALQGLGLGLDVSGAYRVAVGSDVTCVRSGDVSVRLV